VRVNMDDEMNDLNFEACSRLTSATANPKAEIQVIQQMQCTDHKLHPRTSACSKFRKVFTVRALSYACPSVGITGLVEARLLNRREELANRREQIGSRPPKALYRLMSRHQQRRVLRKNPTGVRKPTNVRGWRSNGEGSSQFWGFCDHERRGEWHGRGGLTGTCVRTESKAHDRIYGRPPILLRISKVAAPPSARFSMTHGRAVLSDGPQVTEDTL